MKQHKPWFDEEYSGCLDQKKQAKVRWLQDPSQRNVDNWKSVRRAASRHFRNKKEENLKAKIDELKTNIKIENIRDLYRGISDCKKGDRPGTNTRGLEL